MDNKAALFANIEILIKAAQILDIPIIRCEQNPKALGPTIPQLDQLMTQNQPVEKFSFSCLGNQKFTYQLKALSRKQIILCGIEAHVCIYQTAMDLLDRDYQVSLIADAVSSRTTQNKKIAIDRLDSEGAYISSTEMILFELLKTAKHPNFKEIAKLIK
jgi:isochorismate hydrolase